MNTPSTIRILDTDVDNYAWDIVRLVDLLNRNHDNSLLWYSHRPCDNRDRYAKLEIEISHPELVNEGLCWVIDVDDRDGKRQVLSVVVDTALEASIEVHFLAVVREKLGSALTILERELNSAVKYLNRKGISSVGFLELNRSEGKDDQGFARWVIKRRVETKLSRDLGEVAVEG